MIEASTSTIPDIVTLIESNQTYINIVKKTIVFFNKYMQHAYNIIIESFGSSCTIGDVNSMF